VLATLAIGANVFFWRQSGYFDPDADKAPLLHMWSLSLEEQFYLLFPLALLVLWRVGRRTVLPAIVAGAVASFALSWWGTTAYPGATFYLLPTRAWELLLGGACALAARPAVADAAGEGTWSGRARESMAAGGLLLLLAPMLLLDEYTPFPGVAALAPAVGSAAVLVFATGATATGRLLAWRPFVALGLVSYSAYLVHQPLFVLYRAWSLDVPDPLTTALLVVLTLALAWLSWWLVEQPNRHAALVPTPRLLRRVGAAFAMCAAVAVLGSATEGLPARLAVPASVTTSIHASPGGEQCVDRPVDGAPSTWQCVLGDSARAPTFLVAGDSHARALLPALEAAAVAAERSGRLVTRNGCVPLLDVHVYRPKHGWTDCRALAERTLEYVRESQIGTVVLVARWSYYASGDHGGHNQAFVASATGDVPTGAASDSALARALAQTLTRYAELGVRVVLVEQVPQQFAAADEIYTRVFLGMDPSERAHDIAAYSVTPARDRALQAEADSLLAAAIAASSGEVQRVSLDAAYCGMWRCLVGDTTISWYSDADHLSHAGALRAVPLLTTMLRQLDLPMDSTVIADGR
jgi:hypothetical protein